MHRSLAITLTVGRKRLLIKGSRSDLALVAKHFEKFFPLSRSNATRCDYSLELSCFDAEVIWPRRLVKLSDNATVYHDLVGKIFRLHSRQIYSDNALLYRVVREVIAHILSMQGYFWAHSAMCVHKSGRAICLMGDKHAGKTHLLLELTLKHGFYFSTNDRLALTFNKGELWGLGYPYRMGVREASVQAFDKLKMYRDKYPIDSCPHPSSDKALIVQPHHFAEALGSPILAKAPVGLIVNIEKSRNSAAISPLSVPCAQAILDHALDDAHWFDGPMYSWLPKRNQRLRGKLPPAFSLIRSDAKSIAPQVVDLAEQFLS